MGLIINFRLSF